MFLFHALVTVLLLLGFQQGIAQSCSHAGYDLSPLLGLTSDLYFRANFNQYLFHIYYLRPCSVVSQLSCARNATACYFRRSTRPGNSYENTLNFGTWEGSTPTYSFPTTVTTTTRTGTYPALLKPDGLDVGWQNGPLDSGSMNTARLTTIRYVCDQRTPLANITAVAYLNDAVLAFTVNTSLVCGPRDLYAEEPRMSTLTQCVSYPGVTYSMRLCPRTSSSLGYYPSSMINYTLIKDLGINQDTPMNFSMFGMNRPKFTPHWYGALLFANNRVVDYDLQDAPWYGLNASWSIMATVAAMHSNTIAGYQNGMTLIPLVTWCVVGEAPNRQLVMRWTNRRYSDWPAGYWNDRVTDFDIVLFETTNEVEVRYYKVEGSRGNLVTIGIQGDDAISSTARISTRQPLSDELAGQLQGATLSIYLTSPVQSSSSSSSTGDSLLSSGSSSSSGSVSESTDLSVSSPSSSSVDVTGSISSSSISSSSSDSSLSSSIESSSGSSVPSSSGQSSDMHTSSSSETNVPSSTSSSPDQSTSSSSVEAESSQPSSSETWSSSTSTTSCVSATSDATSSNQHSSSSSADASSSSSMESSSSSTVMSSSTSSSGPTTVTSSSSSSFQQSLSSRLQPNGDCARWYAEDYISMPLDDYVGSLPPGSSCINFVMTGATLPLPNNFDVMFGSDIALNIAFMLELESDDADALVMYIDVTGVNGCASSSLSSRRLLSLASGGPLTLSAFIFGNVTTSVPRLAEMVNMTNGGDSIVSKLSSMLEQRVADGNFMVNSAPVNVTGASALSFGMSSSTGSYVVDDMSTSSSFEWTAGRIAGVVIGCVVGFMLIVALLMFVLCRGRNEKRSVKSAAGGGTELPIYWTGRSISAGVAPVSNV